MCAYGLWTTCVQRRDPPLNWNICSTVAVITAVFLLFRPLGTVWLSTLDLPPPPALQGTAGQLLSGVNAALWGMVLAELTAAVHLYRKRTRDSTDPEVTDRQP